MALVESHLSGGVCTVTLNDVERRNALSRDLLVELLDVLDEADASDDVRVVVLTNAGSVFCAGANLSEQSSGASGAGGQRTVGMAEVFARFGRSPKPYVGKIAGHCVAGGMGLAAAMDIAIAVDTAKMGFTEVRIGVAPAIISVPILARCGWSALAAPFLTGEPFDAHAARDMGLITHVTDDVASTVQRLVDGVLAGAPNAVAEAKRILRSGAPDMEEMIALSAALFRSDEAAEGMRAFAEKRPPRWAAPQEGA